MPSSNGHRSQSRLCPFRGAEGRRRTVRDICVPSAASCLVLCYSGPDQPRRRLFSVFVLKIQVCSSSSSVQFVSGPSPHTEDDGCGHTAAPHLPLQNNKTSIHAAKAPPRARSGRDPRVGTSSGRMRGPPAARGAAGSALTRSNGPRNPSVRALSEASLPAVSRLCSLSSLRPG